MQIKPTKREVPARLVLYGDGGVGKTTFASQAPGAVFITSEDGLVNIDAKAIDPAPQTWEETLSAVDFVIQKTDAKTLVLDSLDWLEPQCWASVCKKADSPRHRILKIEDFGYGKGYVAALDEWRVLLHKLSQARAKGVGIILIAHAVAKTFKNPDGEDFDRWQMKLNIQASGLMKEWCDVFGFAQVEMSTYEVMPGVKGTRSKGISSGRRVLRTDKTGGFDAKTRYAMPKSIPLEWRTFEGYIKGGDKDAIARLTQDFEAKLIELADPSVEANARNYLGSRGISVPTLTEAIETLNQKLAKKVNGEKTT